MYQMNVFSTALFTRLTSNGMNDGFNNSSAVRMSEGEASKGKGTEWKRPEELK